MCTHDTKILTIINKWKPSIHCFCTWTGRTKTESSDYNTVHLPSTHLIISLKKNTTTVTHLKVKLYNVVFQLVTPIQTDKLLQRETFALALGPLRDVIINEV